MLTVKCSRACNTYPTLSCVVRATSHCITSDAHHAHDVNASATSTTASRRATTLVLSPMTSGRLRGQRRQHARPERKLGHLARQVVVSVAVADVLLHLLGQLSLDLRDAHVLRVSGAWCTHQKQHRHEQPSNKHNHRLARAACQRPTQPETSSPSREQMAMSQTAFCH